MDHKFSINGVSVVDVGAAKVSATGEVTHLTSLSDFAGVYTAWSAGASEVARLFGGDVLLVEDNLVNQKVAVRFLERLGCGVHVAGNGALALEAFRGKAFDLVLMDLQMPVMDGITATKHIRELQSGRERTPIVALTASAMKGQLEECLAADMDGLLTKPLDGTCLRNTLSKFGLTVTQVPGLRDSSWIAAGGPADLGALKRLSGGDPDFEADLANTFHASAESILADMRRAVRSSDRRSLFRAAHTLKWASANIYAPKLSKLAGDLESESAQADLPTLQNRLSLVEAELARTRHFIDINMGRAARFAKLGA